MKVFNGPRLRYQWTHFRFISDKSLQTQWRMVRVRSEAEGREPPRQYQSGFLHSFHESFKSTFLAGRTGRTRQVWLETLNQMGIKMWAEDWSAHWNCHVHSYYSHINLNTTKHGSLQKLEGIKRLQKAFKAENRTFITFDQFFSLESTVYTSRTLWWILYRVWPAISPHLTALILSG